MKTIFKTNDIKFFFYDIYDSVYLKQSSISKLSKIYIKSKKIKNSFEHFIRLYKIKKAIKYDCHVDLYFKDLKSFPENQIITIFQNKTLYKFRIANLISMWIDVLYNNSSLFPTPKQLKNPYTNVPFKKNNLYNIYFSILNSKFNIPIIITQFYRNEFCINKFTTNVFCDLKDNAIKNFIENGSCSEKFDYIRDFFHYYSRDINNIQLLETITRIDKIFIIQKNYQKY